MNNRHRTSSSISSERNDRAENYLNSTKVQIKIRENWIDNCVSIFFTSSLVNILYSVLARASSSEIELAMLLLSLGILGKTIRFVYLQRREADLNLNFKKYTEIYAEQPGVCGWKIRKGEFLFLPPEEILEKLQEEFDCRELEEP